VNKKSALTKIKELFSGKKDEDIVEPNTYVVKEGDHLWKISEDAYGSGYNAYDIANANNLNDANLIEVGQELILPEVEPKEPTETSSPTQYTVLAGDHLWGIAQKVYGNPYKWLDISIANNLINPSVIEVGQVLTLP
ncbi:MAG: LysM peptidoglycan-binding domain-containing protein, partial [bacterium]|nr:LysM peptidoglycan-binding domain-containing protein [bacterium]